MAEYSDRSLLRQFELNINPGMDTAAFRQELGVLARKYGARVYAVPDDPVITKAQLDFISQERWDSPAPGAFADSILQSLYHNASGGAVVAARGRTYVTLPFFGADANTASIGPADMLLEEVDDKAYGLLASLKTPFSFALSPPSPDMLARRHGAVRTIVPLAATQKGLWQYVRSKGYHRPCLHGTSGMALDVLAAAADAYPPQAKRANYAWDGVFIGRPLLRRQLEAAGFTDSQRRDLERKIGEAVRWQIREHRPYEPSEVVIRGSNPEDWQEIAVASLRAIGKSGYRTPSRLTTYLQSIS